MDLVGEKVSIVELPPPVIQKKASYPSISEAGYDDFKDEATILVRLKKYLLAEVDEKWCTLPLAGYCFMTGVVNSIIFTAIFIWCGSQTGNTVQLSLAIARLLDWQQDHNFHLVDKQALCSLISFALGGVFGGRIGHKMGYKSRAWLFMGTLIQALLTMASAILMWEGRESSVANIRDSPAWSDTLSFVFTGFLSASMGLQGVMAKRVNTHFSNTVALTATWCELMSSPRLLDVRSLVAERDYQIATIACFVAGGFTGRALIDKVGSANTLGIGAGIRLVISVWWLFVPERKIST